jgi:type III secretion protein D
LAPGEHTVGANDDNEIAISDWTSPTHVLSVSPQGDVQARVVASGDTPSRATSGAPAPLDVVCALRELQPARFGDIVICVGPVEGDWPTDMELLARLFEPAAPAAPVQAVRPQRAAAYAASAGVALAVASCLVAVIVQARPQESAHEPERGARAFEELRLAFDQLRLRGLQIHNEGGAISVDGMVETRDQSRAAFRAIAEVGATAEIRPRFAVAEDVAESIRSSAGLPAATVAYLGDGAFSVTAQVDDPESARAAISRVTADLGPAVKRIDAVLDRSETTQKNISVLSSFSDGGVTVIQTKNGAKYFELNKIHASGDAVTAPAKP